MVLCPSPMPMVSRKDCIMVMKDGLFWAKDSSGTAEARSWTFCQLPLTSRVTMPSLS
jgi:hypothetical protein